MFAAAVVTSFLAFLALPLAIGFSGPVRGRSLAAARRRRLWAYSSRGVWISPLAAAAADAIARSVTGERGETWLSLHCRECGAPSPAILAEDAALLLNRRGFMVTATCGACRHPIISRVFTDAEADALYALGVTDADEVLDTFREQLADL
jgi:hypothetical protein